MNARFEDERITAAEAGQMDDTVLRYREQQAAQAGMCGEHTVDERVWGPVVNCIPDLADYPQA